MSKLLATAGPFIGVRNVPDAPYIDRTKYLAAAYNGYFRDANGLSSWVARPGFAQPNSSSPMGTGAQPCQGQWCHVDPGTGGIYRFFVVNGHLYRADPTFTTFTDVTPGGIAIDNGAYTRVSFASVGNSLVVSDGVNRPWVGTNLSGSPITGAYIDIDGAGGAWTAYGPPTVYQDSVFFITASVPVGSAVQARVGIVWCEPNQPATGYTQTSYANFWNIIENGTDPLYAILGTNDGLFYWRQSAIGVLSGTPSISFSTTATRDARGSGVGSICPWAVVAFANNIFFIDAEGRPWMMPLDGEPQPIWEQLSGVVPRATSQVASVLSYLAIGSVVPELNQVILYCGEDEPVYTPPTANGAPASGSVFDGQTGTYAGEWVVGSISRINTCGVMKDDQALDCLCVVGSTSYSSTYGGGYVWKLTSPSHVNYWNDANSVTNFSPPSVTIGPLSYSANDVMGVDRIVAIVHSNSPVTAILSQDGGDVIDFVENASPLDIPGHSGQAEQLRFVMGCSGATVRAQTVLIGRSSALTVYQWGVQRVELYGTLAVAGPEDY